MLEEIEKIKNQVKEGKNDNFYSRIFYRKISVYFTYIVLRLGLSANMVTWVSVIFALIGCFLISFSSLNFTLLGLLFIQLWYLFDHVDGEVARITKTSSLEGMYLDLMTHNLIHPIIYFSFGMDVINNLPQAMDMPVFGEVLQIRRIMLFISFIAGLSALIIDLSSGLRFQILIGESKKRKISDEVTEVILRFKNTHPVGQSNPLYKLWRVLWHIFCIPGAVWILTAGSLLDINYILLPVYAVVLSGLAIKSILVRLKSGINTLY